MGLRTTSLMFSVLVLAGVVSGAELIDKIIVKIDRYAITQMELEEACAPSIAQIRKDYPETQWAAKSAEVKNRILTTLIDEYVCVAAARELEITVTNEELENHIKNLWEKAGITSEEDFIRELKREGLSLDEFKETIRRQSVVRKVLQREVYSKVKVTQEKIKEYYEEHQDLFSEPAQVQVALILLMVTPDRESKWQQIRKTADEIYNKLESGAEFSQMTKQFSQGPAIDQGGNIGYIEKGKGLPAFEKIAFNLELGEISKPFRTSHGWNIIKVLDKAEEIIQPFADVSDRIEDNLKMLKSAETRNMWFEQQKKKVYIERMNVK